MINLVIALLIRTTIPIATPICFFSPAPADFEIRTAVPPGMSIAAAGVSAGISNGKEYSCQITATGYTRP